MIERSAVISDCGTWRYELRRKWNPRLPPLLAIMLNPSRADHRLDDPTIRRVWKRAVFLHCGELIVGNLGAGRSPDPEAWMAMDDPIGPDNNETLERLLLEAKQRTGVILVGWGTLGAFMHRDTWFIKASRRAKVTLYCLGHTRDRYPRHPLYVSDATELEPYRKIVG